MIVDKIAVENASKKMDADKMTCRENDLSTKSLVDKMTADGNL